MEIVCLDLEGVLIPEVWINFAEKTGIDELRVTTREIPDYDELMRMRLDIINRHGYGLKEIQEVVATMDPLPGAAEFVQWLRPRFQMVILSDTFYEFVMPLIAKLGYPTLFCHRLEVGEDGRINKYILRQPDPKRASVKAFHSLNFRVYAAGDSYNDTTMLGEADAGFLFDAPPNVVADFPQFPLVTSYEQLKQKLLDASPRHLDL